MISLLSAQGTRVLESIGFTNALFVFDFDGTLSPIVTNPLEAKLSAEIRHELELLKRKAPVAIISGRSRDDLKERLGFSPDFVIGNHGIEDGRDGSRNLELFKKLSKEWKATFESAFKGCRGVEVEDKTYSLAIHYRISRKKKQDRASILRIAESLKPVARILLGKCVVNIIPQGAPHKGIALLEIMEALRTSVALYVGDDDNDEDVFVLPDERILSVRVGRRASSAAKFFVPTQDDVLRVLRFINAREEKKLESNHA